MKWLLYDTVNDISVKYFTAHIYAGGLKKLDLRMGSHTIDLSYSSLMCLPKHRHCFSSVEPKAQ